jgi:hypothetical protein
MIWEVTDDGRIKLLLRASGENARKITRAQADRYIANIVGDLSTTMSIEVTTDELRYSFNKNRPEITVTWRARVPVESVPDVREYMVRLGQSHLSLVVVEDDDAPPDP